MHASDLATYLLRAGYQEGEAEGALGEFKVKGPTVEIRPSSASYFRGGNALRVDFLRRRDFAHRGPIRTPRRAIPPKSSRN